MVWGNASLEALRTELRNVSTKHGYQKWQTQENLRRVLVREGEKLDLEDKEKTRDGLCTMLAVLVRLADEANVDLVKGMEDKLGSRIGRLHKGERPVPLDSESLERLEKEKQSDSTTAKGRPAFKRTLSVVCDSRDPTMLYSPTHFRHDLFSPVTAKKDFDVEYNSRQPLLPTSISGYSLLQTQNSSDLSVPNSPLSPQSLENFYPMVEALESSQFTEEELKCLDLTFCAPYNGKIADLVVGGVMRPVTRETFALFVKLARQLASEGDKFIPRPWEEVAGGPFAAAATAASKEGGRKKIKRTLSVTPLVGKWEKDDEPQELFSPTHFAHDLFSPTTNKTDFDIDYSEQGATKTLPVSLSVPQLPQVLPEPTTQAVNTLTTNMRRQSVISLGSEEEEEYKGLDLLCEVAEERQAAKDQAKLDLDQGFLPVIEEVEGMLENKEINEADLREMDLTFCIPANGHLHELFPGGKAARVTLDRLPEFIKLAKNKKREIELGEC